MQACLHHVWDAIGLYDAAVAMNSDDALSLSLILQVPNLPDHGSFDSRLLCSSAIYDAALLLQAACAHTEGPVERYLMCRHFQGDCSSPGEHQISTLTAASLAGASLDTAGPSPVDTDWYGMWGTSGLKS